MVGSGKACAVWCGAELGGKIVHFTNLTFHQRPDFVINCQKFLLFLLWRFRPVNIKMLKFIVL